MLKLPVMEAKEKPSLNSTFLVNQSSEPRSLNLDVLMYWVKKTPECIGIVKRIATDIVTEITFKSLEKQTTGRPSKKFTVNIEDSANSFSSMHMFRDKLFTGVIDWLITGDFYLWKGRLNEEQVKEIIVRHYELSGVEFKELNFKAVIDEDFNESDAIEVIPSTMVEIEHDETKILNYVQKSKSGKKDKKWGPEEVIHGKLMPIDGKVYGYSPMEASFMALKTLNAIQDYGYNYFANGVKLDRAWLFSGNPNKDYIDKFEEVLKKYKNVPNAHGDIVVSGAERISTERLNEVGEEMEFRKLAIHSVGRLAFAFNMPADILSAILGVDVKGTAMGSDIEDSGYNRNIEEGQRYIEQLLTSQFWAPHFKVSMHLERKFRQDQIRQVQYMSMATPVIEFMFKHEFPVNDEFFYDFLQIPRKYLIEGSIKKETEVEQRPLNLGMPKGQNQTKYSDQKKIEQKPQANNKPAVGA